MKKTKKPRKPPPPPWWRSIHALLLEKDPSPRFAIRILKEPRFREAASFQTALRAAKEHEINRLVTHLHCVVRGYHHLKRQYTINGFEPKETGCPTPYGSAALFFAEAMASNLKLLDEIRKLRRR